MTFRASELIEHNVHLPPSGGIKEHKSYHWLPGSVPGLGSPLTLSEAPWLVKGVALLGGRQLDVPERAWDQDSGPQ